MPKHSNNPLSHLRFQRFEPSVKLSDFIDCYWFISSEDHSSIHSKEYLHPDGGTGIILNYGDTLRFDGIPHSDTCILDGTTTLTRELGLNGTLDAVGIRFKPAGAYLFLSPPLKELKNETITLADIQLRDYPDLYAKLSRAKSYSYKVSIVESWLENSLRSEKQISSIVKESLDIIKRHNGLLSMESLVARVNCSQRQIERLFNLQVGMTPKEYSRTLRIEEARSYIKQKKNISLSKISYDLGYYDQAHFINQFKKVVGITPKEYRIKSEYPKYRE